jgi:hypothetical protein
MGMTSQLFFFVAWGLIFLCPVCSEEKSKSGDDIKIDINSQLFMDLPSDRGTVTPWSERPMRFEDDPYLYEDVDEFSIIFSEWEPAQVEDERLRVLNCVLLISLADMNRRSYEADAPRIVFQHLRSMSSDEKLLSCLKKILAHPIEIAHGYEIKVFELSNFDDLDLQRRMDVYTRKMILRLLKGN